MPAAKGLTPWNKGTSQGWTDKRGYRWLYVDENGKRRARREHRVVMESHLGRRLEPWEIVHHKDEDPSNNALENLELTTFDKHTSQHHTGSRRSADARRSMEAFALLREELKAERSVKSELLEALQEAKAALEWCVEQGGGPACEHESGGVVCFCKENNAISSARAAIAKATGGQP